MCKKDESFQTKFNDFYRVRRNQEFRKIFYEIFENSRYNQNINFEIVLTLIKNKTNRIEASFASKLIVTINPNLPVLDKFVLRNVNLKLPYQSAKDRFSKIIKIHDEPLANSQKSP